MSVLNKEYDKESRDEIVGSFIDGVGTAKCPPSAIVNINTFSTVTYRNAIFIQLFI